MERPFSSAPSPIDDLSREEHGFVCTRLLPERGGTPRPERSESVSLSGIGELRAIPLAAALTRDSRDCAPSRARRARDFQRSSAPCWILFERPPQLVVPICCGPTSLYELDFVCLERGSVMRDTTAHHLHSRHRGDSALELSGTLASGRGDSALIAARIVAPNLRALMLLARRHSLLVPR